MVSTFDSMQRGVAGGAPCPAVPGRRMVRNFRSTDRRYRLTGRPAAMPVAPNHDVRGPDCAGTRANGLVCPVIRWAGDRSDRAASGNVPDGVRCGGCGTGRERERDAWRMYVSVSSATTSRPPMRRGCTRLPARFAASRSGTTCWSRPSSDSGSRRSSNGARTGATTESTSPIRTRSGRRCGSRSRTRGFARWAR